MSGDFEGMRGVFWRVTAAALCVLLALACGWLTAYLHNTVDDDFVRLFGTLVFGGLTINYLIVAVGVIVVRQK